MIWVDVEDLFQYASRHKRPSGIQRVEYELCRALADLDPSGDIVRFIRSRRAELGYCSVPFSSLDACIREMARADYVPDPFAADKQTLPRSFPYRWLKAVVDGLPPGIRASVRESFFYQKAAFRSAAAALAGGALWLRDRMTNARAKDAADAGETRIAAVERRPASNFAANLPEHDDFERLAQPGDFLLMLGAPWFPGYAVRVSELLQRKRLRLAVLMYDIVPLRCPEWCTRALIAPFAEWVSAMLPISDVVLTISRATAADLERYADETKLRLRFKPVPIAMGTGFSPPPSEREQHLDIGPPVADGAVSPAPPALSGAYALMVGTIEARKNHVLLFRVWRRLLEDMAEEAVPTLVFAGHVGWQVADLMEQLRNSDFLRGKIVVIEHPTDADLGSLYKGCQFTLFPSFYEGWGLPVSESLSYGCPCIISSATSLPEAGGELARYFDPDNVSDAYRVIRAAIEDPDDLAAWRARIAREFHPVPWTKSAGDILAALNHAGPTPPPDGEIEASAEQLLGIAV